MKLPMDVCRCYGKSCDEDIRNTCLRYLQREQRGPHTPIAADLFPYDIPITEPCPMKITDTTET